MINTNQTLIKKRLNRIRNHVVAVSNRPRLVLTRSNQHIVAQIVDLSGKVVCTATSQGKEMKGTKTEIATEVGKTLAKLAKDKGIDTIVFDRGSYRFHGRVKALAEAVRQSGINF